MKKSLLLSMILPLSLHAMEESPREPAPAFKVMTRVNEMNLQELGQLTQNLKATFTKLNEERIVSSPFDVTQATILVYSYKDEPPVVEGLSWDLMSSKADQPEAVNFFSLLQLYTHLNHETTTPQKSFFSFGNNDSDLKRYALIYKYANIAAQQRLDKPLPAIRLSILAKNTSVVQKIAKHFAGVESSLTPLPDISIWNWLTMRYHLTKTATSFGLSSLAPTPLFYEPVSLLDLLTFNYSDNKAFISKIDKQASALTSALQIPIVTNSNTTPKKFKRILKTLFSEVPRLGYVDTLKQTEGFHEFFTFAQLYLDLGKNYKKEPTLTEIADYPYNITKLTPLLSTINGSTITPEAVVTVLNTPGGQESIDALLHTFTNPFVPTLQEINTFCYHTDQIMTILQKDQKEKQETLKKSQEVKTDISESLVEGIRSDLQEFFSYVWGK